ncbi:hypothetical protein H257_10782 [Aphanomyces astaci]|uniref:Cx9C motif-containing protein 4, mitochondrial n=1 Tax=Aphanomyces astaci TaxID=112090 RepID=W4G6I5_APHAT|nr:hypothetical protein H257_10782 [Aphanomyces astaci]ETV74654.1 hypothetical protein H257_10782 [Aphanomyces astaci]|eukprot:XP_009835741.1 hypothetical protein H257_10782 [Aphanomyces astaci]
MKPSAEKANDDNVNWDMVYQRACRQKACAIQMCLSRHKYQESKCQAEIDAYKACCTKARGRDEASRQQRHDASASSSINATNEHVT